MIPSPCRQACALDAERRTCTGCKRTIDEITAWPGMTDAEKTRVLERLAGRDDSGA